MIMLKHVLSITVYQFRIIASIRCNISNDLAEFPGAGYVKS